MPTAYTCDIKDGIDFKTYAMNCARAFGACVTLRDEPDGGEYIPDSFEASNHHLEAYERANKDLNTLAAMTSSEAKTAADSEWSTTETTRLMRLADTRKQREAYEAMLEKSKAWKPPSPAHEELREFMCSQIEQSILFDCSGTYNEAPTARLTGSEWVAKRKSELIRNIQYHEKMYKEEKERVAARTEWVRALRVSLS